MTAEGTGTDTPGQRHLKGGADPPGSSQREAEKTGRVWEEGMLVETSVTNLLGLQRGRDDIAHSATDS